MGINIGRALGGFSAGFAQSYSQQHAKRRDERRMEEKRQRRIDELSGGFQELYGTSPDKADAAALMTASGATPPTKDIKPKKDMRQFAIDMGVPEDSPLYALIKTDVMPDDYIATTTINIMGLDIKSLWSEKQKETLWEYAEDRGMERNEFDAIYAGKDLLKWQADRLIAEQTGDPADLIWSRAKDKINAGYSSLSDYTADEIAAAKGKYGSIPAFEKVIGQADTAEYLRLRGIAQKFIIQQQQIYASNPYYGHAFEDWRKGKKLPKVAQVWVPFWDKNFSKETGLPKEDALEKDIGILKQSMDDWSLQLSILPQEQQMIQELLADETWGNADPDLIPWPQMARDINGNPTRLRRLYEMMRK